MTLFKTIENLVQMGYNVSFNNEGNMFSIVITHREEKEESWLPISDHFYESRIVECLDFMYKKMLNK
jgi:choline kinase